MNKLSMSTHIQITEGHPRGFCSNLLCLYGAIYRSYLSGGSVSVYNNSLFSLYTDAVSDFKSYRDILSSPLLVEHPDIEQPIDMGKFLLDTRNALTFQAAQRSFPTLLRFNKRFVKGSLLVPLNKPDITYDYAIHRRCTDHSMHEKIQGRHVFFNYIKSNVPESDYFYLATDSGVELEAFISEFGERVIFSHVERSSSDQPVHFSSPINSYNVFSASLIKNQRMFQVFADIVRLARAKVIFCTNSGIPYTSKLINPSINLFDFGIPI